MSATTTPPVPATEGNVRDFTALAFAVLSATTVVVVGIEQLLRLRQELTEQFDWNGAGLWLQHLGLELSGAVGSVVHRLSDPAEFSLAGVVVGVVVAKLLVLVTVSLASSVGVVGSLLGSMMWDW
jgi:hypothetical protein